MQVLQISNTNPIAHDILSLSILSIHDSKIMRLYWEKKVQMGELRRRPEILCAQLPSFPDGLKVPCYAVSEQRLGGCADSLLWWMITILSTFMCPFMMDGVSSWHHTSLLKPCIFHYSGVHRIIQLCAVSMSSGQTFIAPGCFWSCVNKRRASHSSLIVDNWMRCFWTDWIFLTSFEHACDFSISTASFTPCMQALQEAYLACLDSVNIFSHFPSA